MSWWTSRRCTSRNRSPRSPRCRGAAGSAGGRVLRYRVSPDDAAGGRDVRSACAVARALARSPLRLPRPVARVDRAARAAAARRGGSGAAARQLPPRRGRSLCAIAGGRSVDTTMGFTPLEGLVMATRSGSVDPGLVLWLLERTGGRRRRARPRARARNPACSRWRAARTCARCSRRPARAIGGAQLALEVYAHRLRAGSPRWSPPSAASTRSRSPAGSASARPRSGRWRRAASGFLGLAIDQDRNARARGDRDISAAEARVRTLVIEAREDLEIARQARAVIVAAG